MIASLQQRPWGVWGMAVAESVGAGLVVRDGWLVANGVLGRLRPVPAALLRLELAAGVVTMLTGLPLLLGRPSADQAAPATAGAVDIVWRAALVTLFAVHTIRFAIYLRPDQGRRRAQRDVGPALARAVLPDGQHRAEPGNARLQR